MVWLLLQIDGRSVRCRLIKTSPALPKANAPSTVFFLVHGITCSSEAFAPLLVHIRDTQEDQKLTKGSGNIGEITYIAPDMPGYNFTRLKPQEAPLSIDALAAFNLQMLIYLNLPHSTHIHVVGNSMGCQVAVAMANIAPQHQLNLHSIILCGPTVGGSKSTLTIFSHWWWIVSGKPWRTMWRWCGCDTVKASSTIWSLSLACKLTVLWKIFLSEARLLHRIGTFWW